MNILTEPKRIDLPFIELPTRRNPELKENYLLLHDTYMEYKNVSEYEYDDDETGLSKRVSCNHRWVQLRADILFIDMCYDNTKDTWAVCIETRSNEMRPSCFDYKEPKEALVLYNQLKEYFVNRP